MFRSYEQTIQNGAHPAFLKFYAPWCKHCKALAPTWNTLAKLEGLESGDLKNANPGDLIIGAVDCDDYVGSELCEKFDVDSFPRIMYFSKSTGGDGKRYTGAKDLKTLREFVMTEFKDGLACGPGYEHLCDEEELGFLALIRLHTDELLEAGVTEKKATLETLERDYKAAVQNLTSAFEDGMNANEKETGDVMKAIYILKSWLPGGGRHTETTDQYQRQKQEL